MARKRKSPLGVTFWMALLVFVTLIYLAHRIDFPSLFGEAGVSGFVAKLFGGDYRGVSEAERPARPSQPPELPKETPPPPPEKEKKPEIRVEPPKPAAAPEEKRPAVPAPQPLPAAPSPQAAPAAVPAAPAPAPQTAPAARTPVDEPAKVRDGVLYFIKLSADGGILPAPVTRRMPAGPAPLSETIAALLAGPTPEETREGILSLIPPGTALQSASAKDGTASLSFNENLRFNSFGIEGFRGQVRQIVFTATEFPTVRNVQILIDGGKVDFLSPEGLYIGKPLGRESF